MCLLHFIQVPHLSNVSHDSVMIVGGEGVVAGDGDGGLGRVVGALSGGGGGAGGVGVVPLLHLAPQLQVAEPQLGH